MSDQSPLLIEQATQWLVLLRSGQASVDDWRAFDAWRSRDARHQQLWDNLEKNLEVFRVPQAHGVNGQQVQRTLAGADLNRRQVLHRALMGAGVALGVGLLANRSGPLSEATADVATATGQRQRLTLDDGSELVLNARSAVDIDFNAHHRVVRLRSGEVQLNVTPDSRPLRVANAFGQVSSHSGRLQVRLSEKRCLVQALEGSLQLATQTGEQRFLAARQQVTFDRYGFGASSALQSGASAWVDGLLEVRNQRLEDVVDALRPYRNGVLRVDPAVADLRVTGLYHLDDSNQVLDTLARTLPIRIARRSDLWVTVVPA